MMVPKFRAWDKKTKEYFHISELWNSGTDPECFHFDGWTDNFGSKGRLKDIVIEQFTGLKDVNDKTIYDGDIVVPVMTILGKVKRMAHPFEVKSSHYVYERWIATYVSERGFGVDGWYTGHQMEVIGNIHENLELLEGE